MRRKLILSWSEAVVITAGNLRTIVLFAFNKKRRGRKRLYLLMNMAFADLLLGGEFPPLFVFVLATRHQFVLPAFLTIILTVFSQASFITTAALISAERFYAIYWPLKHRTFSTLAYRLVIWTGWTVDIGYPCFHDICSAILKPKGCVLFHLFIRLVSSCDYLRPEHRHLEKVSSKGCSVSRKQSHANSAFNESPVNSICCHFEFFKSFCSTQHILDVLHDFGFAHIFFQFFCQSYGVRIENS